MLEKEELEKIKEFLEKSQNPLFFFDNDMDGLCSYLILQRAIGRGKGVAIKSFPDLNKSYLRKIEELSPDAVFILDKAVVSKEFIDGVNKKALPIIWIDHHSQVIDKEILENINYFNSLPSAEPVTYIAYNIFKKKQDMWIAIIGCIADIYMPDFAEKFSKDYPELLPRGISAFDAIYMTEIGKIIKILSFGLKDTTTNVIKLMKFLIKSKDIYDILEENSFTRQLHRRYKQLNKIYENLLKKAESNISDSKLLFFSYSGDISMSAEIANELEFKNKDKIIVVAYKKSDKTNISIRGKNAREFTLKALKDIENSSGGGHEQACGAQVPTENLNEFKENLEIALKEYNNPKTF